MNDNQVIMKPVPTNLGFFARLSMRLFGGNYSCSYCGKFYKKCYSKKVGLFTPLGGNGKCCPDGHEGYTDHLSMSVYMDRQKYDFVKENDENKNV